MPWVTTGGGYSGAPGGGSTITVEERNTDTGETRTTETTRDAGGNQTHRRQTTRDRNGNETSFEETDAGPPRTRRTKTTKRERGRVITEEEEFVGGVRRRRTVSTFYPDSGRLFLDIIVYDKKGKRVGKTHIGPGFHYNHDLTRLPDARLFRDLPGYVALPSAATIGVSFGGSVAEHECGNLSRIRVKNSEGMCVPIALETTGRFWVPSAFTTPGVTTVELIDLKGAVTFSAQVAIREAEHREIQLDALNPHEHSKAITVATGHGLSSADATEPASAPVVVLKLEDRTLVRMPIAYSDLELSFATPREPASAHVHRGGGHASKPLDCETAEFSDC